MTKARPKRTVRRKVPAWTPFERVRNSPAVEQGAIGLPVLHCETWQNSRYAVFVYHYGDKPGFVHLSIKHQERLPLHDWRDLQRIKNELCGTASEGAELYPAEDRIVDTCNQYHLWVKRPGERFDFGYTDGRASSEDEHTRAFFDRHWKENYGHLPEMALPKQRPFEPHHRSAGLAKVGPVWEAFDGA